MTLLLAVLLAASDGKEPTVSVDSVTVNGETTASSPTSTSKSGTASGAAATATPGGQQWSVVTARTLGKGGNALQAGVGFPGVHAQFTHGMLDVLDLGGRVSVNYGLEGQVSCDARICGVGNPLPPGVKVQALARYKLYDNGKVNAGVQFAPGLLFFFPRFLGTQVGFTLPLQGTLGIVVSPAMNVGISLELPMWIKFGTGSGLALPVLAGAGFEYFIMSTLAVFFELKMGPTLWSNSIAAAFTFDGKLGVGWRF